MKNKATLRDIAKEANVSVATASYVLNNRDDQSISEATRKKVLQIANLYGYKLNFPAKCISSGKTNIIAMCLGKHRFALHKAEHLLTVDKFCRFLAKKGYSLSIFPNKDVYRLDYCNGIVCCDTDIELFRNVAENNYCPLLALNSGVHNPLLFYQVNTDFVNVKRIAKQIFGNEDYCVVSYRLNSAETCQQISDTFANVVFADDFENLDSLKGKNVVALGEMLGEYCKRIAKDVLTIDFCSSEKLEKLFECFDIAFNRKDSIEHSILV